MNSLAEMFGGGEREDPFVQLSEDIEKERLVHSYKSFLEKNEFTPGMLVKQKKVASGYRSHGNNDIGIVVEILDPPIVFDGDVGSPYYRKPLDMIIGHLTVRKDGSRDSFDLYHVDSRHYEPA